MSADTTVRALDGTRVLSVGHTLPGLYCVAMLRDLGARVVRIERPAAKVGPGTYAGMDVTFPVRSLTAGTDSLRLDLKHAKGVEVFRRLARQVDVVLEGFRPGVMERLGTGYEVLSRDQPGLVYAAISGYGQSGPERARAAHDINYLAETGVLALGNPRGVPGVTFADGMAGLSAALNIVAALHARGRTGRGQMIDCAIVDGPMYLMTSELEYLWATGECRGGGGTHLTGKEPWYGVHATADGRAVAVGAVEPRCYEALCRGLGHPELADRQFSGGEVHAETTKRMTAAFASRGRDEIVATFAHEDACVSPLRTTREVAASSLMARATRRDAGTAPEPIVRTPVRLPPAAIVPERRGADVLAAFGFSTDAIEELTAEGVIGSSQRG